jgi:ribonuclease HI
VQDEAHVAWVCDIVADNEDPRIQKSNYLRQAALRDLQVGKNEAFWVRGLMPEAWLPPRRDIKERWQCHGDFEAFRNATHFGTDGAGGKFNSCPRLRGCGAGAAAVSQFENPLELVLLGGVSATVEGRQTVPRAELTAVCIVLALARQSHIFIFIDASYVFNGLKKGAAKSSEGVNGELWVRFWELLKHRGGRASVTFTKVKSHVTDQQVLNGVADPSETFVNELADKFADIGAKMYESSENGRLQLGWVERRAWLVQNRLLAAAP